jgi:hypothetical protein
MLLPIILNPGILKASKLSWRPLCSLCLAVYCLFRYTKYRITSLEKNYMPKMIVPEDLGIPLDLLDMSVYK